MLKNAGRGRHPGSWLIAPLHFLLRSLSQPPEGAHRCLAGASNLPAQYMELSGTPASSSWGRLRLRLWWCWRLGLTAARQWTGPALRFHLALFYLHGLFYHMAKRFTGVRYIFGGRLMERRPSYSILGILLFVQLSLSAGVLHVCQVPDTFSCAISMAACLLHLLQSQAAPNP